MALFRAPLSGKIGHILHYDWSMKMATVKQKNYRIQK